MKFMGVSENMIYPRNGFPMGKMMIHQWFFWLIFRQTLTNPLYIYIYG